MEPVSHGKFRHFFASMRADGPEALEFAWMDYAHFESLLMRCVDPMKVEEGNKASSSEDLEETRTQFFLELTSFLQTYVSQYETFKKFILTKRQGSTMHRAIDRLMRSLNPFVSVDLIELARRKEELRLQKSDLSRQAFWLCVYIKTTGAALRQLVRQFDLLTDTKAGTDFLREFHASTSAHSDALAEKTTFLMELQALQSNLERRGSSAECSESGEGPTTACAPHCKCKPSSHGWAKKIRWPRMTKRHTNNNVNPASGQACERTPGEEQRARRSSVPEEVIQSCSVDDNDLQCAICLDLMHRPVSLGCGHCFCTECVLAEARRVEEGGGAGAPARESSVAKAGDAVRCPLCRREGVAKGAVELPELDRLIRLRFPEQWLTQRQEHQERAAAARRAAALQRIMTAASRLVLIKPLVVCRPPPPINAW